MSRNAALAALNCIDPEIGAFIEIDADSVLAEAEATRRGRLSGTLIGVKDLIDTAGLRTTYGSIFFKDHVPERNALIIDALKSEGAIILGKTNLNEFAYGGSGYNPYYGPILNPKDRSRTAGGSSGGSAAAVAAGVCRLAVGTDTSGSVRIPAACCGVYGMKLTSNPTLQQGIFPLARSFDSLGYLAAGIECLQKVLNIRELPQVQSLRVRFVGRDVEVPTLPEDHWTIFRKEVSEVHKERYKSAPEKYGNEFSRMLACSYDDVGDVGRAKEQMKHWRRSFYDAVGDTDVLVGPMLDRPALTLEEAIADYERGEGLLRSQLVKHTPIYNALGWPALAVPTEEGSVQVAARQGDEPAILAVGRSLGLSSAETVSC